MARDSVRVSVLKEKNMAEAWMAWSLKAAKNWATRRPRKVRECRWSAGWKVFMGLRRLMRRGGERGSIWALVRVISGRWRRQRGYERTRTRERPVSERVGVSR